MNRKKQMNNKLKIGMLLLIAALVVVSGASAYPSEDVACTGCHTLSSSVSITATTPKTTVTPGESFVVTVTWSPSGATAKWPSVVNDNALFGIPSGGVIVSGSGTGTTTLTAPSAAGTYKVTVYASTKSGGPITNFKDITITVQAAPTPVLTTITVSPLTASKVVGETQTFTANGSDQNGGSISISPAVFWSSSNTTVGTINPTTGAFNALASGTTTITAKNGTSGTVSGTASVTVTLTPVLTTITVSPTTASKVVGGTQTFTAAGFDQNGGSITISPAVVWSSSNTTVGTINSAGVFTALEAGTTTITATNGTGGTVSGTASVTVTLTPVLTTITVSPSTTSKVVGGTQTFTAAGFDQNGGSISIGPAAVWSSSNTTVGIINSTTGVFTALEAGITTIIASNGTDGTVLGMASATVTAPGTSALTTIKVSPPKKSLKVNGTQTFTATAFDQLGNIISAIFTWVSSNPTVGTIDASGKFTALSAGTTTITASNGTINGSAIVSVRAPHNNTHELEEEDEDEQHHVQEDEQEENEQQHEQEHNNTHEHNNTIEHTNTVEHTNNKIDHTNTIVHTNTVVHTNTQVNKGTTNKNKKDKQKDD
ncbi:MAG: Ig-like domain-containing protein [Candidatus Methanoperedens sp.]|nr:Ig-like domain-containing protein [Candidatus Methanoperedens sp.]